jgi:hypothetical protein
VPPVAKRINQQAHDRRAVWCVPRPGSAGASGRGNAPNGERKVVESIGRGVRRRDVVKSVKGGRGSKSLQRHPVDHRCPAHTQVVRTPDNQNGNDN